MITAATAAARTATAPPGRWCDGATTRRACATRRPDHPGKPVLVSTAARFEFPVILASVARMAEAYWTVPTAERRADILRICGPLYRRTPRNPEASRRARVRHGTAPAGVRCPVLVMAGDHDPVSPIAFSETIVASLPPGRVRFPDSGHGGSAMHRSAPSRS